MLFTEYDEEEDRKLYGEEMREEGRKESRLEGFTVCIKNLMDKTHWPIEQCMDMVGVPNEYREDCQKLVAISG